jgi:hypothetical protein
MIDAELNHLRQLSKQIERLLALATSQHQFDAFGWAKEAGGRPLSTLAFYILQKDHLITNLRLSPTKLVRFLHTIEAGYIAVNPYHNSTHASDVLQTLHIILHRSGMLPHYADPLALLACYLAAIVHDYEHLGVTNDYLIATQSDLAIRYNDRSPMENHHLAAAFSVLRNAEFDFLPADMSFTARSRLRKVRGRRRSVVDLDAIQA